MVGPEEAPIRIPDPEVRLRPRPSPDRAGMFLPSALDANRDITFGYLLGYLTLSLHATLEYTRFAGFYVGPWSEIDVREEDRPARAWQRRVGRRGLYGPETGLGTVTALISDGPSEPFRTFADLGVPDPDPPPSRRVAVRARTPRVDLVVDPTDGHAYDLFSFAREIGERCRRNLD